MSYPLPPQICKLHTQYTMKDGKELDDGCLVEWRGDIQMRYDPDMDDQLKFYTGDSSGWIEASYLEFLGRPPGPHTVRDALAMGLDLRLMKTEKLTRIAFDQDGFLITLPSPTGNGCSR